MTDADLGEIRHVTCLFSGRVGDVIVATPLLRAVRRRFPRARLRLVVGYRSTGVLPLLPFVDEWAVLKRTLDLPGHVGLAWELLRRRTDLLIDLNPAFSTTSTLLARAARARLRVSFEKGKGPRVFDRVVAAPAVSEHMSVRYERLARALGAPYSPETELRLPPADVEEGDALLGPQPPPGGFRIAIHPGNFDRFSFRWPEEKFVSLSDRLLDDPRLRLFYVGGPGEHGKVAAIIAALKRPVPVLPAARLGVVGAMLRRMDLFVGNITGTLHLAAALGVPTFGFYAGYTQSVWRPAGERHGGTVCPEWESCRETSVEEAHASLRSHVERLSSEGPRASR